MRNKKIVRIMRPYLRGAAHILDIASSQDLPPQPTVPTAPLMQILRRDAERIGQDMRRVMERESAKQSLPNRTEARA